MSKHNVAALLAALIVCLAAAPSATFLHIDDSTGRADREAPRFQAQEATAEIVVASNNYDSSDWTPPLYAWPAVRQATGIRSDERKAERPEKSPDRLSEHPAAARH